MNMNKYKGTKLRQREKDKHSPKNIKGRYKPKESTRFRLLIRLESLEGQNLKYSRVLSKVKPQITFRIRQDKFDPFSG